LSPLLSARKLLDEQLRLKRMVGFAELGNRTIELREVTVDFPNDFLLGCFL